MKNIQIHWALPIDAKKNSVEAQQDTSGAIDFKRLLAFIKQADVSPIDSLLTPFGFHMPDPFPLLGMLSTHCEKIKFLLAYRPGLMSPTLFTQQMNTLSHLLPNRLNLNVVAGFSPEEQAYYGDHLNHDDRFQRSQEFMSIAQKLWKSEEPVTSTGKHYDIRAAKLNTKFIGNPKIYLSGNSKVAQSQAGDQADCWLRYGDTPENIEKSIQALSASRKFAVGLRLSIVSGSTRGDALERAARVISNPDQNWKDFLKAFVSRSDSSAIKNTFELSEKNEWLSETIWTGAVPYRGGPALAIVGSYSEIADELNKFANAGVSEFILSGWPTEDELNRFSTNIFPLLDRAIKREARCA